jgi:hypothetical protein
MYSSHFHQNHGTLLACYPSPKFPALSITGRECLLNCKHCGGHYLQHMISCTQPDVLFKTCLRLAENGARGVLISGGYNEEGWVPLDGFIDAIERVKRETRLFLNVHTGLIPPMLTKELGRVGVDMASVDLIGSDETIELVLGIKKTTRDYERTLKELSQLVPRVVPHICIGLHEGKIKGEAKALEIAAKIQPAALVFLVLTPTAGTQFEKVSLPPPSEVGRVIADARLKFPNATLALGCMRPRGDKKTEYELQALCSGVDRIEIPSEQTIEAARKLGRDARRLEACCAVPWNGGY